MEWKTPDIRYELSYVGSFFVEETRNIIFSSHSGFPQSFNLRGVVKCTV